MKNQMVYDEDEEQNFEEVGVDFVVRLTKDLKDASRLLTQRESRYLVNVYYQLQHYRIRSSHQKRIYGEGEQPNEMMKWVMLTFKKLEGTVKSSLDEYSKSKEIGRWLRSITGIGPVIASGLIAHVDIHKAMTAGDIWRFAGLDPTSKWVGKEGANKLVKEVVGESAKVTWEHITACAKRTNQLPEVLLRKSIEKDEHTKQLKPVDINNVSKRSLNAALSMCPWNQELKVLCWKIGESFVKSQNKPKSFYGPIYQRRRQLDNVRNESGGYRELAMNSLKDKNFRNREVREIYESGKLPDGHVYSISKRMVVKLFLSHFHEVWWNIEYRKPVIKPYAFAILGHSENQYIPPPNWERLT